MYPHYPLEGYKMLTDDQLRAKRETPAWVEEPATKPQIKYIAILVRDRQVPKPWLTRIEELTNTPDAFTKGKAGEIISNLKKLPRWDTDVPDPAGRADANTVPNGYYAIQTGDHTNDLTFYKVKWGHSRAFVDIVAGPDYIPQDAPRSKDIVKRILRAGVGEAATAYGREVGRCSQCGRRLTNRISRELAIGPVCGGRVYPDDWQTRVSAARTSLLERGIDPNEKVEDEGR